MALSYGDGGSAVSDDAVAAICHAYGYGWWNGHAILHGPSAICDGYAGHDDERYILIPNGYGR